MDATLPRTREEAIDEHQRVDHELLVETYGRAYLEGQLRCRSRHHGDVELIGEDAFGFERIVAVAVVA